MDSKQRFSSRVDDYIKYRPGYPAAILETLSRECGLTPDSVVADIGSGTGILTRLFLDYGCPVSAVEPNTEMRQAAEHLLAAYPRFTSLATSAEETGLPDASVDLIVAGQAFHWFDPRRARDEFLRILKPAGGWVALIWNSRKIETNPFLAAYNQLLTTYCRDYADINHNNVEVNPTTLPEFFGAPFNVAHFENVQIFDFEGVRGRLMSSSYAPEVGHPNHAPMLVELRRIFDLYQQDNHIAFEYDTRMYYGHLTPAVK
jgi:SAM-dependent methyltransferase